MPRKYCLFYLLNTLRNLDNISWAFCIFPGFPSDIVLSLLLIRIFFVGSGYFHSQNPDPQFHVFSILVGHTFDTIDAHLNMLTLLIILTDRYCWRKFKFVFYQISFLSVEIAWLINENWLGAGYPTACKMKMASDPHHNSIRNAIKSCNLPCF